MQVRSINKSNNTNFNSLYASKKTLKAIRCTRKELLSNRSIREAAENRPLLNSLFCDRSKLAAELSVILNLKHANPKNRADYTAREYIQTYYNEFVNPDKTVKLNEGV